MSIEEFIITVFCLLDDQLASLLKNKKLRQRGFATKLSDSEVITMEIVGEFLGFDQDKAIWQYFKQHWSHFFPNIPDRTNFARQAANLHILKRMLHEKFAELLGAYQDRLHIIERHVRLFSVRDRDRDRARDRTEFRVHLRWQ